MARNYPLYFDTDGVVRIVQVVLGNGMGYNCQSLPCPIRLVTTDQFVISAEESSFVEIQGALKDLNNNITIS